MFDIEKTLSDFGLTPEKYEELLKDCSDKVHKVKDIDWSEISEKYNVGWNGDSIRKAQQPILLGGTFVSEYYKWKESQDKNKDDDEYLKELDIKKRELQKERNKLQTEKLEYNKWLREEARDEMILESITNAISNLKPLNIPKYIEPYTDSRAYLLAFGDAHYGIEFQLKDLFGNVINEYSPEIFEKRMWDLYNQIIYLIDKEDINELHIWDLGDGIQGILRLNSQLMKLRYGIIDSSILYANFLAEWLNELSSVRIKFQMVIDSNHNQLRICNAPKNAFPEENMSKSMLVLIKERLKNNSNITIIENPTGMNYGMMTDCNILGIHGEVKNLSNAINEFSRTYGIQLDYLVGAHCHHLSQKETGIRSEVLSIRSIIGVDPYALSLNKTSDAGASLFVFDRLKGKTCEYSLKLN